MKKMLFVLLILTGFAFAQEQPKSELEDTQIQLARYTVIANKLQVENQQLREVLARAQELVTALGKVENMQQLDSLRTANEIPIPKKDK